jgi:hypothetical protein
MRPPGEEPGQPLMDQFEALHGRLAQVSKAVLGDKLRNSTIGAAASFRYGRGE